KLEKEISHNGHDGHNEKPLTTETQRKAGENQGFVFDFFCVSVVSGFSCFFVVFVVPVVAKKFFAFLRALRG
ncbi:MAG: hypothetical protein LBS70_06765, partial [Candidatus Accumulibacter sp.]|nr:hypothetical protein [Accumulibacter sp.]